MEGRRGRARNQSRRGEDRENRSGASKPHFFFLFFFGFRTLKLLLAGVGSTAPPAEALTWTEWVPKVSVLVVNGEAHGLKAPPSTLQE